MVCLIRCMRLIEGISTTDTAKAGLSLTSRANRAAGRLHYKKTHSLIGRGVGISVKNYLVIASTNLLYVSSTTGKYSCLRSSDTWL